MDKKTLGQRLDSLCSTFVRCNERKCFTCGKPLHYAYREAGHFLSRRILKTRWDLDNIHVQCHECNVVKGGNLGIYAQKLSRPAHQKLMSYKDLYDVGKLPEPTYKEKAQLYNNLLGKLRGQYPQRVAKYQEWQKIE